MILGVEKKQMIIKYYDNHAPYLYNCFSTYIKKKHTQEN